MEKLNALIEALYPQYGAPGSCDVDVTARRKAIDESAASIAEAFRALEQEKVAAEHERDCQMDIAEHFKERCRALEQRAESAEAKLAKLEKQEPRYFYREHNSYNGMKTDWTEVSAEQLEYLKEIIDPETAEIIELFTRPAPAVSLAELVPDEMPESAYKIMSDKFGDGSCMISDDMWNECRAAILRNTEDR